MSRSALGWMLWLAVALAAVSPAAGAQSAQSAQTPVRKLGVMLPNSVSGRQYVEVLLHSLSERGWVEGRNLQVVFSQRQAASARVPEIVAEFVRDPVDVIFVPSLAGARTAREATTTIPIVFHMGPDPVAAGLARSLARPGGNLTGIAGFVSEGSAKRLELLRELLPAAKRVALLVDPANPNAQPIVRGSRQAARDDGFELFVLEVRAGDGAELTAAFSQMQRARIEAVVVGPGGSLRNQYERIEQFARAQRLPVVGGSFSVLSYGVGDEMPRVAYYIDRILRGAKPAELPIERPSRFWLTIDLGVAKTLGIKVPESLLRIADEVVE